MDAARHLLACLGVALVVVVPARAGGLASESEQPVAAGSTAGPVFLARNLAPGEAVHGVLRMANAGDADGRFVLTSSVYGDTALARRLRVVVTDRGGLVYRGALCGLEANLGTIAAGHGRRLHITVALPAEVSGAASGGLVTTSFAWTATV